jgi:hypothetical protein
MAFIMLDPGSWPNWIISLFSGGIGLVVGQLGTLLTSSLNEQRERERLRAAIYIDLKSMFSNVHLIMTEYRKIPSSRQ